MDRRTVSSAQIGRRGRAARLAGGCTAALLALAPCLRAQNVFQETLALQQAGQVAEALAHAGECPDPLVRAQARLYVLHHAGDLAGALSAGLDGLREAPEDPWLLERSATLALDLGATELALALVPRFESVVAEHPDRGTWAAKMAGLRERATESEELRRRTRVSLSRARVTAAVAGLLSAICVAWATCRPGAASR